MKRSARNQLPGIAESMTDDDIMAVILVVKSTAVMLGVDE